MPPTTPTHLFHLSILLVDPQALRAKGKGLMEVMILVVMVVRDMVNDLIANPILHVCIAKKFGR